MPLSHDLPLTEDEVRQISRIVETLNQSNFDYLQLELGALKLTIGRQEVGTGRAPSSEIVHTAAHAAVKSGTVAKVVASPSIAAEPDRTGLVAITSPMVGRFYSQPEPGADCFVNVGAQVQADTTVCLVEAMKMFNAVRANAAGTIVEICVQDAELVEYGQVLFYLRPHG